MPLTERRASTLHEYYWLSDPRLCGWIAFNLSPYGSSLCDVGCGTGNMYDHLSKYFASVFLLEPSRPAIAELRTRLLGEHAVPPIMLGTGEAIPLKSKSVDVALAKSSLHHFNDPDAGVREMVRIARRAISLVEVIGPPETLPVEPCLEYARMLLTKKEPGRRIDAVFREDDLKAIVSKHANTCLALHFDQFIDIEIWLKNSDLGREMKQELYEFVRSQPGDVRERMQIHYRAGRLIQSRRMLQVIGVFDD